MICGRGRRFLESIGDTLGLASVYYELGNLKVSENMKDLGIDYYKKSRANFGKRGSARAFESDQKLEAMAQANSA